MKICEATSRLPESCVVKGDASKIMDEHSAATSECYEKLKEMTIRIRSCCNVLDSIVDTAMDSWAVSTRLAGKIMATVVESDSHANGIDSPSESSSQYVDYMERHFDQVSKLYEYSLNEISLHLEELSDLREDMDTVCSDLEESSDEYRDALHLLIEGMLHYTDRRVVTH